MPAVADKESESRVSESDAGFGLRTGPTAALVLAVAIMAFTAFNWLCTRDPKINFLSRDKRAEWILFPRAMESASHGVVNANTVFRREFTLHDQPRTARLELRAAKRTELNINGAPVEIAAAGNWKDAVSIDVGAFLRTGSNRIEARVFNDNAPPALWLTLAADQFTLRSDSTWEASCMGSAWRPAALATTPRLPGPGNIMAGGEETITALRSVWLKWVMFAGIAAVLWIASHLWLRRVLKSNEDDGLSQRQTIALLSIIGGLWIVLFWNNAGSMPFAEGFDSPDHLEYIKYVQERHALPLPNDGLEMFQAPLYYVLSAAALSLCGLSAETGSAIIVLRFLTMIFGVVQWALVFLALRLLLPNRLTQQLVGLGLAAFLPMQLYLAHYVTNETLAATLVTLSLYLGLRLLKTKNPAVSQFAWLGLFTGAAMLSKATALLLVLPLFLTLAINLAPKRERVAIWLRHFGTMTLIFFATCGWHYFRIWRHFGNPLIGNWDMAAGFFWWQDPGFHTAVDYLRFGQSLVAPLFSGFWAFADGIYSTIWGDGLCAGVSNLAYRPPWNNDLMVAGYFLALVPTLVILVGAATTLWRFIREPSGERFILVAFTGALALGVVYMTLKLPYYAQIKAFYGLALVVPLCFFGAIGWEMLTRGRRILQGALGVLLLVWAMNSFASFWIVRSAAPHIYSGLRWIGEHKLEAAMVEANGAVEADPSNASARRLLALALLESGRATDALREAQQAVELDPTDGANRLQLGIFLAQQGQLEPAANEARRAIELGPENLAPYNLLLGCLSKLDRNKEVIDIARDGLALFPFSVELHQNLGAAVLAQKQDFGTAINHLAYALLLRPDLAEGRSNFRGAMRFVAYTPNGAKLLQNLLLLAPDTPVILNEVAWFFATQPDATLRNGPEAVRLAEQAYGLTGPTGLEILTTLAAAYAETNKLPQAIKIAEAVRAQAQSVGNDELVNLAGKLLNAFREGHGYREESVQK